MQTSDNILRSANADRSTHTPTSRPSRLRCALRRGRQILRALMVGLFMLSGSVAWAADYVFYSNNNFLGSNTTTPTTNFVPNASIYTQNGNSFRNANGYYLRPRNGTGTLRFSTTQYGNWTISGQNLVCYTYYYLVIYNNVWSIQYNSGTRATAAVVTTTNQAASLSNFSITSGNNVIESTGTYNYSHSNTSYTSAYTKYSWTDHTYYSTNPAQAASTTAPAATEVTTGYTWTLEGGGTNASVNASSGQITVSSLPATDLEMTLTCSVTSNGVTKTASKTVVLQGTTITAPTISNSNNTISLSTASLGATIYYTTDGTEPSASNGTTYTVPFNIESLTFPVTIKAIATRGSNSSTVSTQTYSQPKCATPVISISTTGAVTITCATEGATIRYIKGDNPDDPTGNTGTQGTSTTLTNLQFIKAIATKTGYENSEVATDQYITSGINNGTIVLDDREDHNWAYYSDNNSPIHCLNPADITIKYYGYGTKTMTSSNTDQLPTNSAFDQDVANTAVQVNKNEAGHTFIYYKTLENAQEDGTGNYPYTIIPNPFQMRPTYGTDNGRWRGFYAWRVKSLSNGLSIKVGNTTYNSNNISSGIIIYAEQEVEFITSNPKGNTVEFEALWAKAYLDDGTNHYSNSGNYRNAYERNFKKVTSLSTYNYPVTISSINPDGSGTVGTVSGPNRNNYTCSQDVKLENMTLGMGNYYIDGNSYNLTIGRGVANGNNNVASAVYGDYSGSSVRSNFTLRIEGGRYSNVRVFYNGSRANCSDAFTGHVYFGSDYDRANNETNNKLVVSSRVGLSQELAFTNAASITEVFVMSGTFGTNTADVEFYMGYQNATSGTSQAKRSIRIYGGDFLGGLAGGIEGGELDANTVYLTMRISGGTIHRYLYGSGQFSPAYGTRQIVITGGTFDSWVSGGCYGTNNEEGNTEGNTYLYFGGYANQTNTEGIFGAGYGNYATGNDKYTVHNSTVVFADEANTAGSVYGGGNNGYAKDDINVYIAGGTISGNVFGGANKAPSKADIAVTVTNGTVNGGVYGGSNQSGDISGNITVDVYGTAPQPASGYAINQVFGGGNVANYSKTPTVTVHCGDDISIGELYGGGNQATVAGTNVTVSGGNRIGYVYGGGRQAAVNGNSTVTIKGGTIENIFGGNNIDGAISGSITVTLNEDSQNCGLNAGNVFGAGNLAQYTISNGKTLSVNILNGLVSGNVYGGGKGQLVDGNQRGVKGKVTGSPQVTIGDNDTNHSVTILGDVYGGGDAADVSGTPVIIVNDHSKQNGSHVCSTSIGYLYGGGNAADVDGTNITINGGTITHEAYGGGHGDKDASNPSKYADVNGNVSFTINGGIISKVFAGSNSKGEITGQTVSLSIAKNGNCPMKIGEVYGGGNQAAGNAGTVSIGCTGQWTTNHNSANETDNRIGYELEGIGTVYGGANAADINSAITLNINSGIVNNVYGGNNSSGSISGTITVNINQTNVSNDCGWYVGNVFGGGNRAAYTGTPTVNITNGLVSKNVYGGGNMAGVGGSTVNVNGGGVGIGIYGGCNSSGTVTGAIAVNINGGQLGTSNNHLYGIFGGGYGAGTDTEGNVTVTIGDKNGTKTPTIYGDIYGGSALGSVNNESTDATKIDFLNGTLHGNIYGGGLGDPSDASKGWVKGSVTVNIGASDQTDANCKINLSDASVYGCNNTNGSPQDNVTVNIYKTAHTTENTASYTGNSPAYAIDQVFGGGRNASYLPENGSASSTKKATVNIIGCTNTIRRVFGGGDAAAATGVVTTIAGGRFDFIFGGGNGENTAANIGAGGTNLTINSGIINHLFGGSNERGAINGPMLVSVNNTGCDEDIKEFFAGGNLAVIGSQENPVNLSTTIACGTKFGTVYGGSNLADIYGNITLTINGGTIGTVFGGSKGRAADPDNNITAQAANITGTVTLNIYGGIIGDAFGGSNINGNITGVITANMDWSQAPNGCNENQSINNIYGGSNLATYTPTTPGSYPAVNIKHGTVTKSVYGGGKGSTAVVTSNPVVTIGDNNPQHVAIVNENVYGGGDAAAVTGNTSVTYNDNNASSTVAKLFGGGNAASVSGTTTVTLTNGKVTGGVYGGCNSSGSVGVVTVALNGGAVGANGNTADVYGGGYGSPTTTIGNVTVTLGNTTVYGDIYGGSALGKVNSSSANPANMTTVTINGTGLHGSVFGGGKGDNETQAISYGDATVNINGASAYTGIYGGANVNGLVSGDILLNINANIGDTGNGNSRDAFGGGYGALTQTGGDVTVNVGNGTNSPIIYGAVYGGSALGTVNTNASNNTTVNVLSGTIHGNIYGGGLGESGANNVNKGQVNGVVTVNIGATDGAQTPTYSGNATIDGSVYGCNNTNGSPKANVTVNVYKTAHNTTNAATYTEDDGTNGNPTYAIDQVFGGGNQADYNPTSTDSRATVHVYTCDNTIRRVFGGGNAAAAYGVVTTIDGGRFDYIFGGGNGENDAANINAGGTNLTVNSGVINYLFGGSNEQGSINGPMLVAVNNTGCTERIKNFFAGGNLAVIGAPGENNGVNLSTTIDCGTIFDAVYGGSNLADIYGNVTMTINGGTIGEVYAGSKGRSATSDPSNSTPKAANIYGNTTLNIYAGAIGNAFGGSNINGNITGSITVNMDWSQSNCAQKSINNVFGASNLATYTPTNANGSYPQVNIKHGTVSGSVFGAGNGDANDATKGVVTSNPVVTIGDANADHYVVVSGNVYGGGNNAAVTGNTSVTYNDNNASSTVAKLFGGGNAAGVSGTSAVTLTNGKVTAGIYGGCNASGAIGGNITVNLNGGTIGTTGGTTNIVFGGGYGEGTSTNGNVALTINGSTVHGHVYGGSALGSVNDAAADNTTVNVLAGTVNGNIYGGGLGEAGAANVAKGQVNGTVTVNIGATDGAQNPTYSGTATINGDVYGCNNTNGSPKANVFVNVYKTAHTEKNLASYTESDATYAIDEVFGGGNQADYNPTSSESRATVHVYTCDNTIRRVFGGGNAAAALGVANIIDGGRFYYVYGGGNGEVSAANINAGGTNLQVHGGNITYLFGGSNHSGTITGQMRVSVDGEGACAQNMYINEFFCGNNEAPINTNIVATIGCGTKFGDVYGGCNQANITGNVTLTIEGGEMNNVYGGSKGSNSTAANITGNVTLNIYGGYIHEDAFGGSNINGNITGTITVNMDWSQASSSCNSESDLHVRNVFGASNLAAYTPTNANGNYPQVNIKHGTVSGSVFGAGNGDPNDPTKGIVTSNPVVTIGDAVAGHYVVVAENVYGGGNNAAVHGSTSVTYNDNNTKSTVAKLFGGGNAAGVTGAAAVTLTNGKVTGGVYGGCNSSGTIGGNALVTVTGGTVGANAAHANIHGGGYGQQTAVSGDVTVNIGSVTGTGNQAVYSGSATIYGDVYGGSALGTVNTIHTSNTNGAYNKTAVNLYGGTIDGNVYGGGLGDANTAALVYGDVDVFQYGAILIARYSQGLPSSGMIFGCNNVNGTPKGHVRVGVYKTTQTNGQIRSIAEKRATHTESDHTYEMSAVFGGGNQAAYVPDDLTNGSTEVFINGCDEVSIHSVYGGGNAASTPATLVTIQGAYEIEYVFGGGNGAGTGNPGANVGYHAYDASDPAIGGPSDEAKAARQQYAYGSGKAQTQIYGGRIHKVFGGSNTLGNVREATVAMLDETSSCPLELDGIYGGGKSAYMEGNAEIELGCVHGLDEIYGGAEQADVGKNIVLTLTSGHYNKVYGGNNLGGRIFGSITVNIEQTGCLPIEIGELYLGGNNAPYSVYGYDANGIIRQGADQIYHDPVMNLRSFKSIGTVFGGGEGAGAELAGNPIINVNVVTGWVDGQYKGTGEQDANSIYHAAPQALTPDGVIGTIFGGGNAAKVTGNTTINIADSAEVKMQSLNAIKQKIEAEIEADPNKDYIITGGMKFELSDDKKSIKYTVQGQNTPTMTQPIIQTVNGANITGNVYGGGNQADVTGGTTIKVGPEGVPQPVSPAPNPAPASPQQQTEPQAQPATPQTNAATESQQTRTANPTRL